MKRNTFGSPTASSRRSMASSPSGRVDVPDGASVLSASPSTSQAPAVAGSGSGTGLFQSIWRDIAAARERDPAARSVLEVILCYPGFHARQLHRLAHVIDRRGYRLTARLLSHLNRALTGIEIHPAARIGEGLFIDH